MGLYIVSLVLHAYGSPTETSHWPSDGKRTKRASFNSIGWLHTVLEVLCKADQSKGRKGSSYIIWEIKFATISASEEALGFEKFVRFIALNLGIERYPSASKQINKIILITHIRVLKKDTLKRSPNQHFPTDHMLNQCII